VCCGNACDSVAFVWIGCLVLLCVFCLDVFFIGLVWVSSVVDLPLFLSLLCRNGLIGLRETHAGRWQPVSDFSTAALFPLGCVLCFVFCGF